MFMDFPVPCLITGVCNMLGIHGKLLGRFRFCAKPRNGLQNCFTDAGRAFSLGLGGIIDSH